MQQAIEGAQSVGITVDSKTILVALVALVCIFWWVWKNIVPEIKKAYRAQYEKDASEKKQKEEIGDLTDWVKEGRGKFTNIESRMGIIEEKQADIAVSLQEIKEIVVLLVKGQLATIEGLQEIGANGPTKKAQQELMVYCTENALHTHKEDMP